MHTEHVKLFLFYLSFFEQWFGQFRFSSWSGWLVELSENSELRAGTIGQAKSTGYFMKLRDWPEFDLIRPAGASCLIVGSKTVRTIVRGPSKKLFIQTKFIVFHRKKLTYFYDD
jgi:hypothetical protein